MRTPARLRLLILSLSLSATAIAAPAPFGDAPGFTVTTRPDGVSVATGRLADVSAASAVGEMLDGLRGAPGLAAAQALPDAQLFIEYRDDRVMRLAVSVPGGASTTLLNKPGGTSVEEIHLAAAASLLQLPANGAVRVRSVEGTGSDRAILAAGPLGDFPTAGPLAQAAASIRAAVQAGPSADAGALSDATPVRVKTDWTGRLLSFWIPRRGGAAGEQEFARNAAGVLSPEPAANAASPAPRAAAVAAPTGAPDAATFLVGAAPATRPFSRAARQGVDVTLNVADLTPEARARLGHDLPTNALAARLAADREPRRNNVKITLLAKDGGFAILNVLPAATVPSAPGVRDAGETPADPSTDPSAALARSVAIGAESPAPGPGAPAMDVTRLDANHFAVTARAADLSAETHGLVERALRRAASETAAGGLPRSARGAPDAMDRALDAFLGGAESVRVVVRTAGDGARAESASVRGAVVTLSAPAKEPPPASNTPVAVGAPGTPRYFSSDAVPAVGNTGANSATGQRALPSAYVSAMVAARAALLNVPPAGMPGHAPALNTARARVTDLVTAFTRLDSDGGFQRTPEADERRADLMGGKGRTGTFRAMNAAGVDPTPRQILAVFADVVRLNAHRR